MLVKSTECEGAGAGAGARAGAFHNRVGQGIGARGSGARGRETG